MLRKDKEAVVGEATRLLAATEALYLSDYPASTVAELTELRAKLREGGATPTCSRTRWRAGPPPTPAATQIVPLLSGPTAVTFCSDDPVAPAKALVDFMRTHPQLVVRGGLLQGATVDAPACGRSPRCRRATCSWPGGRHHGGPADRADHSPPGYDLGLCSGAPQIVRTRPRPARP